MKNTLSNVECTYTGGGVYVVNAKFNDEVWLTSDLWSYGSYDIPWEDINEDCNYDYDSHWKEPSVPYPTWKELYEAIMDSYNNGYSRNMDPSEVERILLRNHPNLNKRLDEE